MNKNTVTDRTYAEAFPGFMKQAVWRQDYEAFRGRVWTWGLYRIQEDGPVYTAFHAGQRAAVSASLYELQLACEGRLE